jgi:hypothetical protein
MERPPARHPQTATCPASVTRSDSLSSVPRVHRIPGPCEGHGPPHGAAGGHCSRTPVGAGQAGCVGAGAGGASSGGLDGAAGAVPLNRSCISPLTHVTSPASALKSSSAAPLAKRAARSRHSAEGSALAGPRLDHHRPSARTMTQMRTRNCVPMCRRFIARPPTLVSRPDRLPRDSPRSALPCGSTTTTRMDRNASVTEFQAKSFGGLAAPW